MTATLGLFLAGIALGVVWLLVVAAAALMDGLLGDDDDQ